MTFLVDLGAGGDIVDHIHSEFGPAMEATFKRRLESEGTDPELQREHRLQAQLGVGPSLGHEAVSAEGTYYAPNTNRLPERTAPVATVAVVAVTEEEILTDSKD